jgi:hypothetical protein
MPSDLVTQGADPVMLKPLALEYASAYLDMVQSIVSRASNAEGVESQRALVELRRVLSIDSVRIAITDYRDRYREAALISPLHPLRAVWFATWAGVARKWLDTAKDGRARRRTTHSRKGRSRFAFVPGQRSMVGARRLL